ncbi:MAG: FkbM family methyltransferase [Pseudomonadota bacterium]|jgi:FkbM family methyltransferase
MNFLTTTKKILWRGLHRLGYTVHRNDESDYPDQQRLLTDKPPEVIFDIGANRGNTVQRYRTLFPKATIHAFEPIPALAASLQDRFSTDQGLHVHQCAISSSQGHATFNVNTAIDTSSLLDSSVGTLSESYQHIMSRASEITVKTYTLDRFCSDNSIDAIHILKMDIQGAELYALQGAEELLNRKRIHLIYTELFLQPFYNSQPLFGEVAAFLGQRDYVLHNIYNISFRGHSGKCGWVDAIFVHPDLRHRSRAMLAEDAAL